MTLNIRFRQPLEITEVEKIHDTHYIIRIGDKYYVKIYLSPDDKCCERFGINVFHLRSPVFLETVPLVGAKLNGIRVLPLKPRDYNTDRHEQTIILYTSVGLVYCVAYNEHNGYYPHDFEIDINTPERKKTITGKL